MDRQITWEKMHHSKTSALEAFKDAKYGMFIHWGLYSLLGGSYHGKQMEEGTRPWVSEWIMNSHKISRTEYEELAQEFNPIHFDATQWVNLAKSAGMKYLIITSKHHDGFSLFDSKHSSFNSVQSTPFGRDVIGELHDACSKSDLRFGLYYSHSIDWKDGGDGGKYEYKNDNNTKIGLPADNNWDPSETSFDEYIENKALPQVEEIMDKYPNLCNIWFDVPYYIPEKYSYRFYSSCFERQPNALINARIGNHLGDYEIPGDNVIPQQEDIGEKHWETVGTMNNSWGYKAYDHDWKSPREVLFWIVEIVSKGGNYTLNVGPDGEGRIPEENYTILNETGTWLKENEEAIYGTRPWRIHHEGPCSIQIKGTEDRENNKFEDAFTAQDFWFTQRKDTVYCINLYNKTPDSILIESLIGIDPRSVSLLQSKQDLSFTTTESGLHIDLPNSLENTLGYVVKIDL